MFENLRRAFSEAVDNFNRELERDAVPEAVDNLLRGMENEAVSAKAGLARLQKDLARARGLAKAERREAEVCRRREAMARRIGDEETAQVAASFGERHERRTRVLEGKADAIEAEVRLLETEYAEMIAQIRKARANRSSLEAAAGRTRARRSTQDADDLLSEFDRMADKVEGADEGASSFSGDEREFDEALGRSRRSERIDARLSELKRRMGRR